MPTKDEYVALCESYTWDSNNALNAHSVVFPAAESCYDGMDFTVPYDFGNYWSSSYFDGDDAYQLQFNATLDYPGMVGMFSDGINFRYCGLSVRPVQK
jgi:hypothetical protein